MAGRASSLNKAKVRFIVRFAGLLVLFYVITTPKVVDRAVVAPFTRGITPVSTSALQAVGQDVSRYGTIIRGGGFAVDIKNGCNGIEALVFLCAAMLAFGAVFVCWWLGSQSDAKKAASRTRQARSAHARR